jgi:hypothetical protein
MSLTRPTYGYFHAHYCWLLINVFETKNFMFSFLKAEKKMSWVLVTQKMIKKVDHCMRDCVLFKEWLQKKRILGY